MRRKNRMDLPSLRRLVKETISETKRRNREVFGNPKSTKRERQRFINETIDKTINLILEADDDQGDGDDAVPAEVAPQDLNYSQNTQNYNQGQGQVQVAQNQGQKKPYSQLLEDIFGSSGPFDVKGSSGGLTLKDAKTKIRAAIKQILQNDPSGGDYLQNKALQGADGDDIIDFVPATKEGADLMPSQMEVFMDQSVDGYLTRPNDFCKNIINGNPPQLSN